MLRRSYDLAKNDVPDLVIVYGILRWPKKDPFEQRFPRSLIGKRSSTNSTASDRATECEPSSVDRASR